MDFKTILGQGAHALGCLAILASTAAGAAAQTLNLTDSSATVLRGGTYANTNLSGESALSTRASSDASYVRRIVLKFDTQSSIPLNTPIASAVLTLTVQGGNVQNRTLSTYRIVSSYEEVEATWNRRSAAATWANAGGELAERYGSATATSAAGSRVSFDVTALVRATVNGTFGSSRYSRIAIVDAGSSSRDSYKEFFSDEAGDATVRPLLTVTLGSTPPAPAPPPPASSGTILKVLDWNIHHGVGTDGVYNIDRIGAAIARTGADVVSLNEVERFNYWGNEDQPARFAAILQAQTGKRWYYNFASNTGAASGQGNLLLSTFPIESSADGLLSHTRSVAQIRIIVNGRSVNLFSVHLDADSSTRRTTQIAQLKTWMGQFSESRIVAGDFNAWPGTPEERSMTSTFRDTWADAKAAGTAVSYAGNEAGNTRNSRIDYIWLSRGASTVVIRAAQVFDFRDSRGVMPSDHRPLMGTYEVR